MTACKLVAYRCDRLSITLEHSRDRTHAKFDAADGSRFENRTLVVCEPRYVAINDASQILRDRDPPQSDRHLQRRGHRFRRAQ